MLDRAWCAAVITAAGASERMGSPKALVEYGGRPLLEHQLAAVEGFGQRVVVLGAAAEAVRAAIAIPADVTVVVNPGWESGRSGSLRCGFGAVTARARAILVCGVDQPVAGEVLGALLAAFDPAVRAYAVPVVAGRRGHPVLVSSTLLPVLGELADVETLRDLLARYRDSGLEVSVESPAALLDLNWPEDLSWAGTIPT